MNRTTFSLASFAAASLALFSTVACTTVEHTKFVPSPGCVHTLCDAEKARCQEQHGGSIVCEESYAECQNTRDEALCVDGLVDGLIPAGKREVPAWAPPRNPDPNACSQLDIDNFMASCMKDDAESCKYVSSSCTDCIVSKETSTSWAAIVVSSTGAPFLNRGGCIALQAGDRSNESCGAKVFAADSCETSVCDQSDDTTIDSCFANAAATPCHDEAAASSCAGTITGAEAACGEDAAISLADVEKVIRAFCASPSAN